MAAKKSQALAIRISRERRAGKNIPPPPRGRYGEGTRKKAEQDLEAGRGGKRGRKKARKSASARSAPRKKSATRRKKSATRRKKS
jgi:hypothetical protein